MQFRDLSMQYSFLKSEIDSAIQSTIDEGIFILGSKVQELEEKLAEYAGVKHCISCANGTDALTLVLRAWGVGMGNAVFVPNFTYIATASAVSILGVTPVFVDIDPVTFNMCPDALADSIQRVIADNKLKARAIIPVDLFGLPADYDAISEIAKKYDLLVLEDAAQGFGGSANGKRACSFGDAAITSFFPAKPLGCYGDGGAVFTNDDELCRELHMLRRNGASPKDKYDNLIVGVNSRLDTIQAAILSVKLDAFDEELEKVNYVAGIYTKNLSDIVVTPPIPEGYCSSWAQYTIKLPNSKFRDDLQVYLKSSKIPSMIYYPKPLHRQMAFRNMGYSDKLFTHSIRASETVLSLPMHPYLGEEDIGFICNSIKEGVRI